MPSVEPQPALCRRSPIDPFPGQPDSTLYLVAWPAGAWECLAFTAELFAAAGLRCEVVVSEADFMEAGSTAEGAGKFACC